MRRRTIDGEADSEPSTGPPLCAEPHVDHRPKRKSSSAYARRHSVDSAESDEVLSVLRVSDGTGQMDKSAAPARRWNSNLQLHGEVQNKHISNDLRASELTVNCGFREVVCKACNDDVSREPRVKCVECRDVLLCIGCFAQGAELEGHKRFHDYYISEGLRFDLLIRQWTADEELLLLEGIEIYGLGNWREVAEHVRSKDLMECARHYSVVYCHSSCAPLPDPALDPADDVLLKKIEQDALWGSLPADQLPEQPEQAEQTQEHQQQVYQHVYQEDEEQQHQQQHQHQQQNGYSHEVYARQPKDITDNGEENFSAMVDNDSAKREPKRSAFLEVAGYIIRRGEFEDVPFEMEAESVIADIMFTNDDTPGQRGLKLKVLHAYNKKLAERDARVQAVLARGLLDTRRQRAWDRSFSKDERDAFPRARVFQRFFDDPSSHLDFVRAMAAEKALRSDIERVKGYRERGYRLLTSTEPRSRGRIDIQRRFRSSFVQDHLHGSSPTYLLGPISSACPLTEDIDPSEDICRVLDVSRDVLDAILMK